MKRPGRNEPCHCGSGKKYKKCCEHKDELAATASRVNNADDRSADNIFDSTHDVDERLDTDDD
jgi:hypothetical protein